MNTWTATGEFSFIILQQSDGHPKSFEQKIFSHLAAAKACKAEHVWFKIRGLLKTSSIWPFITLMAFVDISSKRPSLKNQNHMEKKTLLMYILIYLDKLALVGLLPALVVPIADNMFTPAVRTSCLNILTVICGGTFLVEQPGSSLMEEYCRFKFMCAQLRVPLAVLGMPHQNVFNLFSSPGMKPNFGECFGIGTNFQEL